VNEVLQPWRELGMVILLILTITQERSMFSTAFFRRFNRRNLLKGAGASSVESILVPSAFSGEGTLAPISSRPTFRVLSLDGGGVRGYLSARILSNIEKYIDQISSSKIPLGLRFDFIAGTSTGGIIALALATGRTAYEIVQFYEEMIPKVFSPGAQRLGPLHSVMPKYDNTPLRRAVEDYFKDATLEHVQTDVCITSVALGSGKPRLHKSDYFRRNIGRSDERLSDIALATSAAPTYFQAHRTNYSGPLIDGGICANNPSMVALADAISFERPSKRGTDPATRLSEISLLSIGTGEQPAMPYNTDDLVNAGLGRWALYISDVLFESQSYIAHFQAKSFLQENYRRINPKLPSPMSLDDVSHFDELKNYSDITNDEEPFIKMHLI
jgi:uncharacterized protein